MDEIKVNEELTKFGLAANDLALLKAIDPEAYKSTWQNALSVVEDLYKGREKEAQLDVVSDICEELIKNPYSLIELMELLEDKES